MSDKRLVVGWFEAEVADEECGLGWWKDGLRSYYCLSVYQSTNLNAIHNENVNSGGVFRKGYSNKKETVAKTEPQQPNDAVSSGSSLSTETTSGTASTEPNGEPSVSNRKGTTNNRNIQISGQANA